MSPGTQALKVDAFMAALAHPCTAEVQAVRAVITGVHAGTSAPVTWHAPSVSAPGSRASCNRRERRRGQLVFHHGALLDPAPGVCAGAESGAHGLLR